MGEPRAIPKGMRTSQRIAVLMGYIKGVTSRTRMSTRRRRLLMGNRISPCRLGLSGGPPRGKPFCFADGNVVASFRSKAPKCSNEVKFRFVEQQKLVAQLADG